MLSIAQAPWLLLLPAHTFFTMEGGDGEFANFTLPTSKALLEGCIQNVFGNKQKLVAHAIRCPKTHFLHDIVIFWSAQKMMQRHFFPHHPSPSSGHFCNCNTTPTMVAFVLLHNSRFHFHCYTQREAMPTQKTTQKWCCNFLWLLARKITKGIHLCKPASLNCPIADTCTGAGMHTHCTCMHSHTHMYVDMHAYPTPIIPPPPPATHTHTDYYTAAQFSNTSPNRSLPGPLQATLVGLFVLTL